MKILDPNFKKNYKPYVIQSLLAMFSTILILLTLQAVASAVIVASIGSSIFILFTMPTNKTIRKRNIMGGYLIGILCGISMAYLINNHNFLLNLIGEFPSKVFFTSISVGLSIFLMVIFNFEHPPATGIALGLAIKPYNEWTILFILVSGLILTSIRELFGKRLKKLL